MGFEWKTNEPRLSEYSNSIRFENGLTLEKIQRAAKLMDEASVQDGYRMILVPNDLDEITKKKFWR